MGLVPAEVESPAGVGYKVKIKITLKHDILL